MSTRRFFNQSLVAFATLMSAAYVAPTVAGEGHDHKHGEKHEHGEMDNHMGPLHVMSPWVRPTVPAQKATGAYMGLMAHADGKLVGAKSDIAATTEVHEMSMEGDIMRMRRVEAIAMEEGDVIKLQPGGYHVMFMGLTQQIKAGDKVNFTLVFEGKDGKLTDVPVTAEATMKGGSGHEHGHDHGHNHNNMEHKH